MTAFEKTIQVAIIKWLKGHGAYVLNVHGSRYMPKGTPDLLACVGGVFVAIEVKRPGEKPTELQQYRLERIEAAGGIAFCAHSVDEVAQRLAPIVQAGTALRATISFYGE